MMVIFDYKNGLDRVEEKRMVIKWNPVLCTCCFDLHGTVLNLQCQIQGPPKRRNRKKSISSRSIIS